METIQRPDEEEVSAASCKDTDPCRVGQQNVKPGPLESSAQPALTNCNRKSSPFPEISNQGVQTKGHSNGPLRTDKFGPQCKVDATVKGRGAVHSQKLSLGSTGAVGKGAAQVSSTTSSAHQGSATLPQAVKLRCIVDPNCVKTFRSSSELDAHLKQDHGLDSDNGDSRVVVEPPTSTVRDAFLCGPCNKTFKTKCGLINHMSVHTGIYRFFCDKCQRGFNKRTLFEKDQNKHAGRGYICLKCNKNFLHPNELDKHIVLCTGKSGKSLQGKKGGCLLCLKCMRVFLHDADLEHHLQSCAVTFSAGFDFSAVVKQNQST